MNPFPHRLKERVDYVCQERGLTVEGMAKELGLGRSRFRHYWERGSRPDNETMLRIADYLEVDINWLFGRKATPHWPKTESIDTILVELAKLREKLRG